METEKKTKVANRRTFTVKINFPKFFLFFVRLLKIFFISPEPFMSFLHPYGNTVLRLRGPGRHSPLDCVEFLTKMHLFPKCSLTKHARTYVRISFAIHAEASFTSKTKKYARQKFPPPPRPPVVLTLIHHRNSNLSFINRYIGRT
jgi:hypothetical protein